MFHLGASEKPDSSFTNYSSTVTAVFSWWHHGNLTVLVQKPKYWHVPLDGIVESWQFFYKTLLLDGIVEIWWPWYKTTVRTCSTSWHRRNLAVLLHNTILPWSASWHRGSLTVLYTVQHYQDLHHGIEGTCMAVLLHITKLPRSASWHRRILAVLLHNTTLACSASSHRRNLEVLLHITILVS